MRKNPKIMLGITSRTSTTKIWSSWANGSPLRIQNSLRNSLRMFIGSESHPLSYAIWKASSIMSLIGNFCPTIFKKELMMWLSQESSGTKTPKTILRNCDLRVFTGRFRWELSSRCKRITSKRCEWSRVQIPTGASAHPVKACFRLSRAACLVWIRQAFSQRGLCIFLMTLSPKTLLQLKNQKLKWCRNSPRRQRARIKFWKKSTRCAWKYLKTKSLIHLKIKK